MIWITPVINASTRALSEGLVRDPTFEQKVDRAWDMLEFPDTADSIEYFDLVKEIEMIMKREGVPTY